MAHIKKPYGDWSQHMLAGLRELGLFKVEAFLGWLAEHDIEIDRTLVSHWAAGRSHFPADLLPHLAEFTGRPELVFGPYLHGIGCELVRIPEGKAVEGQLTEAMLVMGGTMGHLQQVLMRARAPDSPAGKDLSTEECAHLRRHLEELIQQLADFNVRLGKGTTAS